MACGVEATQSDKPISSDLRIFQIKKNDVSLLEIKLCSPKENIN